MSKPNSAKLSTLRDGARFRLSLDKRAATYRLQRLQSKKAIITSVSSGMTFYVPKNRIVFIRKPKS